MRKTILFLLTLAAALPIWGEERTVGCGEWVSFRATSRNGFHFEQWSDGSTDSVRTVQATESATYIAFFSDACVEYANWPVVALYDWLIMLNVNEIERQGLYVDADGVSWYRVVGDPDDPRQDFPQDDQPVCTGYYLTLDQNLAGTGLYYAVATVVDPQGRYCEQLARSMIVDYHQPAQSPVRLAPNNVVIGQTMRLSGLNPDEESRIAVFSSTGRLVERLQSIGEESILIEAYPVAGCYMVMVEDSRGRHTVRYIVNIR